MVFLQPTESLIPVPWGWRLRILLDGDTDPVCLPSMTCHPVPSSCVSLVLGTAGIFVDSRLGWFQGSWLQGVGAEGGNKVLGAFVAGGVPAGCLEKFAQEPLALCLGMPC